MRKKQIIIGLLLALALALGWGWYKYQSSQQAEEEQTEQPAEKPEAPRPIVPEKKKEELPVLTQPEDTIAEAEEDTTEVIVEELAENQSHESSGVGEVQAQATAHPELSTVYISRTKSLFASNKVSVETFKDKLSDGKHAAGKVYYQGDNGKLESSLSLDEKGHLHEYLAGFDPKGNKTENIEIGWLSTDKQHKKYAIFLVNKLSIFEEERVTEYTITPQLRFKKGKTFTKIR